MKSLKGDSLLVEISEIGKICLGLSAVSHTDAAVAAEIDSYSTVLTALLENKSWMPTFVICCQLLILEKGIRFWIKSWVLVNLKSLFFWNTLKFNNFSFKSVNCR